MEYVLLGFLMIRALSQYDMYQALSRKVSPFYSASLGSIQTTLGKLEKKGFVTVEKIEENGRKKNLYTLTNQGKAAFNKWMLEDFSEQKFEVQFQTKLFFLGHLCHDDRIKVVEKAMGFIESAIMDFKLEDGKYQDLKDQSDLLKYQLKTLDLGRTGYESTLDWLIKLRREMEAQ